MDDRALLVAAGKKRTALKDGRQEISPEPVDLGLYRLDMQTGELTLLYNDAGTADFEARPLRPRPLPPVRPESPAVRKRLFTGTLFCNSAFNSQNEMVTQRARLVRVVEALPPVARHQTHTNSGVAWKNHGGSIGRVLGTVPLAADGSFALEVPADRLVHLQALDSDRRVIENDLTWIYVRPGEQKGCVGCHARPDMASVDPGHFPRAVQAPALRLLPTGQEFRYRAKVWFKGHLPDEREERQRTVQSITWFGRQ
jgi:hypothetical protein